MTTAMSPVPGKKEAKKMVDFFEALHALREGKKVHNVEWGDASYFAMFQDKVLRLHKPDGKFYDWILTEADIDAEGYIIL